MRVTTISLKEIIQREDLSRIDFLKLDCEKTEHDILKRMSRDTTATIMHITMETHGIQPTNSIHLPTRLQELGFEVRMERNNGYVYARRFQKA